MKKIIAGLIPLTFFAMSWSQASAQSVPGYERLPGKGLSLHNIGSPKKLSVSQCAAACNAHSACKAFEYFPRSSQCLLNDTDARLSPRAVVNNRVADLYQRVATVRPPVAPRQPDWRVSESYCRSYAKLAVDQQKYNQRNRCGYSGRRWSTDYNGHFSWCRSAAPSRSIRERSIRHNALLSCQRRAGSSSSGTRGGSTGRGSGGVTTASETVCVKGYRTFHGAGIIGHNWKTLRRYSLEQCRRACNGLRDCKSFEYASRTSTCLLSQITHRASNVKFVRPRNHPWDYYERCNPPAGSQAGASGPWTTAKGRQCFERWIAETTNKLNRYDGGPSFNGRKPFRVNQYGLFVMRNGRSIAPPDDWTHADVNRNRYAWMWKHWNENRTWHWNTSARRGAPRIPLTGLRYYVRQCLKR